MPGIYHKREPELSEKERIELHAWVEEKYGKPGDPNYRRCVPINPPCVHFPDCNVTNPTPPHPVDYGDYDLCARRKTGSCSRGCGN
jgi:hypothetical protein